MRRREFCGTVVGASTCVSGAGRAAGGRGPPPGVAIHQPYPDLPVSDVVRAHNSGVAVVGDAIDGDGLHIFVTDPAGRIRVSERLTPPEGMDGRGTPAVTRTTDGYVVSSGGWVGVLNRDLTVRTTTTHPEAASTGHTRTVATDSRVVVAHETDTPNHVSVTVTGYDPDGAYRWHRTYGEDRSRTLDFLVRASDGVVVGGSPLGRAGLWTVGVTADGSQQSPMRNTEMDTDQSPAAAYDDGLVVFDGTTLLKLDGDRSISWTRSHGSFAGRSPALVSLPGGGTLAGAGTTLGAFTPDGGRRWVRTYDVPDARSLAGLVVLDEETYIAAGSGPNGKNGWLLRLSTSITPTASPSEPTGASPTRPPGSGATTTRTDGTTATSPAARDTTVPGFGVGAAVAALVWIGVRLCRGSAS